MAEVTAAIYKYQLDEHAEHTVFEAPIDFSPLTAQIQNGLITVWAEVDPNDKFESLTFRVVGTGWTFDKGGWTYIDTVQMGSFVWHVYFSRK